MNDLLNNIIKPKNTKELFKIILKIISDLYNKVVPQAIKNRKK